MKILFVSQYFYPENFRINDLAVRLTEKGHEVTVLTGIPNYPKGRFYEGYDLNHKRREKYKGVKINRVPVIPRKRGKIWLCLNYLSFVIMGCIKAAKMKKTDYDVIYAFGTSPITQALPALIMKKRAGTPVILNVQDLWPDNVIAITGLKNKAAIKLIDIMVDGIYNACDVILGTSHSFVKAIRSRKNLKEPRKVGYWPQYSVVEKSREQRRDLLPEGVFNIVFAGNVGEGQGLDYAIEAADILREKAVSNFCFHIFGDGRAKERLSALVRDMNLDEKVLFHGSVPEGEIPGILNTADAALLILNSSPIFEKTLPAKLQTYLACGTPVVACVGGEAKIVIEKNKVGVCATEMSGQGLSEAVMTMMNMSAEEKAACRAAADELTAREFNAVKLVDALEGYMKELSK